MSPTAPSASPDPSAARDTSLAWWSLLGFVPSFFLAFGVGEGLASLLGYPPGGAEQAPVWAMLVATIPALLAFALPAFAATFFGRRAVRHGDRRGRTPMIVGIVIALGFVATNVLGAFYG